MVPLCVQLQRYLVGAFVCALKGETLVAGGAQRVDRGPRGVLVVELKLEEALARDQVRDIAAAEGVKVECWRESEFFHEIMEPSDQVRLADNLLALGEGVRNRMSVAG